MRYSQITEAATTPFALDPALDPAKYAITGSFKDVAKWRAYTYVGDGQAEKGGMAPVGYVMISKSGNTIIPISRGDEHHHGFDLLHDLREVVEKRSKGKITIDVRDYAPVWAFGNNYIYAESEIPIWLNVLGKYLSWGGQDGILQGSNNLRSTAVPLSVFVKSKGQIKVKPGTIAPVGEQVLAAFRAVAEAIQNARGSEMRSIRGKPFQAALAFQKFAERNAFLLCFTGARDLAEQIRDLQKADDLDGLEKLFFDFHGVKNTMHNRLRRFVDTQAKGERDWDESQIKATWGDVELAIDMLGRL